MLTTDLLINRQLGEAIIPKRLALDDYSLDIASSLIAIFRGHQHQTRGEVDEALADYEADLTDYRTVRGLAHIIQSGFCEYETVSPLEPSALRERVFAASSNHLTHNSAQTERTLEDLAQELSRELNRNVLRSEIAAGLYADLNENKRLVEFREPTPVEVVHRYNLAQAQGVLYRASQVKITAYRNDPGEYKLLFRYLKLFRLMTYIEGDESHGFTLTIDGPTSLFKASTRYGLDLAKLLPALLHVTKWSLIAEIQTKDPYTHFTTNKRFILNSECELVSHYPPGAMFDSIVEESFADAWSKLDSEWKLEREVELVPLPGSVMIPDFRLAHPDGRAYLLEIVGYWRPEYLRKKMWQVEHAHRDDLILAVSDKLNLENAGVELPASKVKIIRYRDKLSAKAVLEAIEGNG